MTDLEAVNKYANECAKNNECTVEKLNLNKRAGTLYMEIERQDGDLMSMNLCTKISKEFCKMLQVYVPNVKNSYNIEIASTGADKTLKSNLKAQEFSKYINRTINAQFYDQEDQVQQGLFSIIKAEEDTLFLALNCSAQAKPSKLSAKACKENEVVAVKYDKLIKVKLSPV